MFKYAAIALLGAGLVSTVPAVRAQDRDHEREERRERYYDKERKDYHEWNEQENRAWRRYWEEQHRSSIEWQRANEEQREAYWRWRHNHPDSMRYPAPERR